MQTVINAVMVVYAVIALLGALVLTAAIWMGILGERDK